MTKPLASAVLLDLKVEQWLIEAIKPDPRNARTHSAKQIAQIAAAIRRFGFLVAILIAADGTVLAGHGRLAAAKLLGMTMVPVIRLDHMNEAERRAFVIADNRLAELAGWDYDILAIGFQELAALDLDFDLEVTGFDGADLDQLLGVDIAPKIDPKADQIPEPQGPAVSRPGDLWILGKHRLVCGDARDPSAYDLLMPGEQARMVFTDPPYNVRVVGNVRR
jgi:hypothetical protein